MTRSAPADEEDKRRAVGPSRSSRKDRRRAVNDQASPYPKTSAPSSLAIKDESKPSPSGSTLSVSGSFLGSLARGLVETPLRWLGYSASSEQGEVNGNGEVEDTGMDVDAEVTDRPTSPSKKGGGKSRTRAGAATAPSRPSSSTRRKEATTKSTPPSNSVAERTPSRSMTSASRVTFHPNSSKEELSPINSSSMEFVRCTGMGWEIDDETGEMDVGENGKLWLQFQTRTIPKGKTHPLVSIPLECIRKEELPLYLSDLRHLIMHIEQKSKQASRMPSVHATNPRLESWFGCKYDLMIFWTEEFHAGNIGSFEAAVDEDGKFDDKDPKYALMITGEDQQADGTVDDTCVIFDVRYAMPSLKPVVVHFIKNIIKRLDAPPHLPHPSSPSKPRSPNPKEQEEMDSYEPTDVDDTLHVIGANTLLNALEAEREKLPLQEEYRESLALQSMRSGTGLADDGGHGRGGKGKKGKKSKGKSARGSTNGMSSTSGTPRRRR